MSTLTLLDGTKEGIQADGTFVIAPGHFNIHTYGGHLHSGVSRLMLDAPRPGKLVFEVRYQQGGVRNFYGTITDFIKALHKQPVYEDSKRFPRPLHVFMEYGGGEADFVLILPNDLRQQLLVWFDSKLERGLGSGTLGAVKTTRYPGFVPSSHYVTVVDSGSFANAGLAKAGIQPVVEGLSIGTPTTQPLQFDDYEAKFCQALKGGGNPPCRVHLSSTNGQMAVRLCDKLNEPGTVVAVKDAHEALARSKEFCTCARNKPDETRKKCARKVRGH